MIPTTNSILSADIEVETQPSLNYRMYFNEDIIAGTVDNLDAMRQVIFKILNTERFDYPIYSQRYGIELEDLFGMPLSYVCAELESRISDALLQDDRITAVANFEYITEKRGEVQVTFTVSTIFGDVDAERVVNF